MVADPKESPVIRILMTPDYGGAERGGRIAKESETE